MTKKVPNKRLKRLFIAFAALSIAALFTVFHADLEKALNPKAKARTATAAPAKG